MKNFQEFFLLSEAEDILQEIEESVYLDPVTGKNWRARDIYRQLKAVVQDQTQKGVSPKRIWVTFTNVPKIGARMSVRDGKTTPTGVFSYPATHILQQQSVPYAGDRHYMIVFKVKGPILDVGFSLSDEQTPEGKKWQRQLSNLRYAIPKVPRDVEEVVYSLIHKVRNFIKEKYPSNIESLTSAYRLVKEEFVDEWYRQYAGSAEETAKKMDLDKIFAKKEDEAKAYLKMNYSVDLNNFPEFLPEIKEFFHKALSPLVHDETNYDNINYPMKEKFEAIAKELGVNVGKALSYVVREHSPSSGKEFVYRLAEALAKEAAKEKNKIYQDTSRFAIKSHWHHQWNVILRKLGFSHVVDSKHTGKIHSAEPTQGATIDTTKIEPITIINTMSHTTTRPKQDKWDYDQKIHSVISGPEKQRRNSISGYNNSDIIGKSNLEKTLIALSAKFNSLIYNLSVNQFGLHSDNHNFITLLIKLLKTINSFSEEQWNKNKNIASQVKANKVRLKEMLMNNMLSASPKLKRQAQVLLSLLQGQSNKEIFKKNDDTPPAPVQSDPEDVPPPPPEQNPVVT